MKSIRSHIHTVSSFFTSFLVTVEESQAPVQSPRSLLSVNVSLEPGKSHYACGSHFEIRDLKNRNGCSFLRSEQETSVQELSPSPQSPAGGSSEPVSAHWVRMSQEREKV